MQNGAAYIDANPLERFGGACKRIDRHLGVRLQFFGGGDEMDEKIKNRGG